MKRVIEAWKDLFSKKKKIIKILEEIRELGDADRVAIYTLGNNTSVSTGLNRTILYEVTRDKQVEKISDVQSERPLDEEDFHNLEKLLVEKKITIYPKDISSNLASKWERFKIENREMNFICLNRKGNYHLTIDNPKTSSEEEEVSSKIEELRSFF